MNTGGFSNVMLVFRAVDFKRVGRITQHKTSEDMVVFVLVRGIHLKTPVFSLDMKVGEMMVKYNITRFAPWVPGTEIFTLHLSRNCLDKCT